LAILGSFPHPGRDSLLIEEIRAKFGQLVNVSFLATRSITASLELAFQVAEYFGLGDKTARRIAKEVGQAVASWRNEAQRLSIRGTEIDRMASAFEHEDLRQATNPP
jgi:N-acetylglucosamine kinase-like BadF-type ATPase